MPQHDPLKLVDSSQNAPQTPKQHTKPEATHQSLTVHVEKNTFHPKHELEQSRRHEADEILFNKNRQSCVKMNWHDTKTLWLIVSCMPFFKTPKCKFRFHQNSKKKKKNAWAFTLLNARASSLNARAFSYWSSFSVFAFLAETFVAFMAHAWWLCSPLGRAWLCIHCASSPSPAPFSDCTIETEPL